MWFFCVFLFIVVLLFQCRLPKLCVTVTQFNITGCVYSRVEYAESVYLDFMYHWDSSHPLDTVCTVFSSSNCAASVYVIQLILSDLLQIILVLISTTLWESRELKSAYKYCLVVFDGICIAIERYLLVSYPIWYRTHHSVKFSCFIGSIIW